MKLEEFKIELKRVCEKNKIMLLEEQIEKFYKYMNLLIEWNQKINLTAIVEPKEIIQKHFIDSMSVLDYIQDKKNIIDVGTGAGFPGIPIKIANPNINVTLLDSLQKRVNFLSKVVSQLELDKIKAVHSRAEDYAKENRESYDVAISRAVANMSTLVEYLLPYVKQDGIVICMKGPNIEDELEKSKKAIIILGGKIEHIEHLFLDEEMERNLIIIRKIKPTPKQYPRKAGKPAKEPI